MGYYAVNNRGVFGKAGANIISLYVQDQWQIGDRLTLNIGLRTENENVPDVPAGHQDNALRVRVGEKLAPRLGFSYDVMGKGRAKLYASYGRYYDWTKYEMPRGSFGGDIWCIKYRAIDNPNDPIAANFGNAPGRDLWKGERRLPRSSRAELRDGRRDAKPMSQDSYSAGFDFEVNPRTVATVHFVHNNLEPDHRGPRRARRRQRGVFARQSR